jgi:rare lipoprotein A
MSSPAAKPTDPTTLPEVTPRLEPLSKRGNPAFYEVDGVRYFVKSSAADYVERGVASVSYTHLRAHET